MVTNGDHDADMHTDNEAGEEQYTPADEDETPSKKSKPVKMPNTPKWKKTQAKKMTHTRRAPADLKQAKQELK